MRYFTKTLSIESLNAGNTLWIIFTLEKREGMESMEGGMENIRGRVWRV